MPQGAKPVALQRLAPGAAKPPATPHPSPTQPAEELRAELVDLPTLAVPKQGRRAEFVPAHSVHGGSGKAEPAQTPKSPSAPPGETLDLDHDPILFVSHSQGPLDALMEPVPDEPVAPELLLEALVDVDEDVEPNAGEDLELEETKPCMRVRLAPRRRLRRALCVCTLGMATTLALLAARSWYPLESSQSWGARVSLLQETLLGYLGR